MITDHEGAYWLSDKIAIAQRHILIFKSKDFQVWDLKVHADQRAMLTCGDGIGRKVYVKRISFKDFPEPGIRFYYSDWPSICTASTDQVV